MEQWVRYLLPILAGLLSGWITAVYSSRAKLRELETSFRLDEQRRDAEERAKNKLKYLDPLWVAAIDLHERLDNVNQRTQKSDTLLPDTVSEVSTRAKGDAERYADWANGMGQCPLGQASYLYLFCPGKPDSCRTALRSTQFRKR
jgi:hypothetical protein